MQGSALQKIGKLKKGDPLHVGSIIWGLMAGGVCKIPVWDLSASGAPTLAGYHAEEGAGEYEHPDSLTQEPQTTLAKHCKKVLPISVSKIL